MGAPRWPPNPHTLGPPRQSRGAPRYPRRPAGPHRRAAALARRKGGRMSVFLHYDQKALDAEYNNRAKVKDATDWIARYGAESARVRAELPMRFDVPLGRHHAERLDVFPASGAA